MLIRAAAKGLIDFSRADPLDNNWWRYVHWILRELQNQEMQHLSELDLQHALGLLGSRLTDESMKTNIELAGVLREDIRKRIDPWQEDITPKDHAETRRDAYAEAFGDPTSEAHQAAQAKLLAQIEHNLRNPPSGRT